MFVGAIPEELLVWSRRFMLLLEDMYNLLAKAKVRASTDEQLLEAMAGRFEGMTQDSQAVQLMHLEDLAFQGLTEAEQQEGGKASYVAAGNICRTSAALLRDLLDRKLVQYYSAWCSKPTRPKPGLCATDICVMFDRPDGTAVIECAKKAPDNDVCIHLPQNLGDPACCFTAFPPKMAWGCFWSVRGRRREGAPADQNTKTFHRRMGTERERERGRG